MTWAVWHLAGHPLWRDPQALPLFLDEILRRYPAGWLGSRVRFLIRDRDGKFPDLFDSVLKEAGIEVVLSGVQMPRMKLDHGAMGADLPP